MKYLDAEVERLEKVEKDLAQKRKNKKAGDDPKNDPPIVGNEVLNVIRIVRTRVCAQVDLMMGEDVAVLTRMLSFDDRFMMRAALRTGGGGEERFCCVCVCVRQGGGRKYTSILFFTCARIDDAGMAHEDAIVSHTCKCIYQHGRQI